MSFGQPYSTCPTRIDYGMYGPHWHATTRGDISIATHVRNQLVTDRWVNADEVEIDVNHRVVTLNGEVDSVAEKRAASDGAWAAPDVVDVINNLKVRPPAPRP